MIVVDVINLKNRFFVLISIDMKKLNNIVRFLNDYLKINEIKDDRLYEALDLIVENTQYLSKTIDDFRNFFKADKIVEDFCINESITHVLKLLKSSIQNHNIQVETHLDGELIINGYPNEFLQVLVNLINNAKDALATQPVNLRFMNIKTYIKNKKYVQNLFLEQGLSVTALNN